MKTMQINSFTNDQSASALIDTTAPQLGANRTLIKAGSTSPACET